jgi:hypothetical protein
MVAVVGKPLTRSKVWEFTNNTVSLNYDLLTDLVGDNPFPAPDRDCLGRLIIDCYEINERIRPIRRRLKRRHIDELVDRHADIGQFAKHGIH